MELIQPSPVAPRVCRMARRSCWRRSVNLSVEGCRRTSTMVESRLTTRRGRGRERNAATAAHHGTDRQRTLARGSPPRRHLPRRRGPTSTSSSRRITERGTGGRFIARRSCWRRSASASGLAPPGEPSFGGVDFRVLPVLPPEMRAPTIPLPRRPRWRTEVLDHGTLWECDHVREYLDENPRCGVRGGPRVALLARCLPTVPRDLRDRS